MNERIYQNNTKRGVMEADTTMERLVAVNTHRITFGTVPYAIKLFQHINDDDFFLFVFSYQHLIKPLILRNNSVAALDFAKKLRAKVRILMHGVPTMYVSDIAYQSENYSESQVFFLRQRFQDISPYILVGGKKM